MPMDAVAVEATNRHRRNFFNCSRLRAQIMERACKAMTQGFDIKSRYNFIKEMLHTSASKECAVPRPNAAASDTH